MSTVPFIWDRPQGEQPAFPQELPCGHGNTVNMHGLTKREYFAALAMQGLLSDLAALRREGFRDREITEFAVLNADALLAELSK